VTRITPELERLLAAETPEETVARDPGMANLNYPYYHRGGSFRSCARTRVERGFAPPPVTEAERRAMYAATPGLDARSRAIILDPATPIEAARVTATPEFQAMIAEAHAKAAAQATRTVRAEREARELAQREQAATLDAAFGTTPREGRYDARTHTHVIGTGYTETPVGDLTEEQREALDEGFSSGTGYASTGDPKLDRELAEARRRANGPHPFA
jgi:hypothetical protein